MPVHSFHLKICFRLDLCHQATDKYEDEEEEEEEEEENNDGDYVLLPALNRPDTRKQSNAISRKCCPCWRFPRIRSRQKFVIGVGVLLSGYFEVYSLHIERVYSCSWIEHIHACMDSLKFRIELYMFAILVAVQLLHVFLITILIDYYLMTF